MENEMTLTFLAKPENESLARLAITSFIAPLDPLIDELAECKTIVSEAVSNAIIHGYNGAFGYVTVQAILDEETLTVIIQDDGCGMQDIEKAREPLYTTKPELERSGMGFTIMESFADELLVESVVGKGTTITFSKKFSPVALMM